MKRLLEEAERIIGLNSVSQNGDEELCNYLSSIMQDSGLKVSQQLITHSIEGISKRQFNVLGVLGDPLVDRKIRKGLLLLTHLDTAGPGITQNWTQTEQNPFALHQSGEMIFGLGVADAKLDFLCKLYAVQRMRDKKLKQPVYLVGSSAQQLGMLGSKYLIQSYALNPRYVLVSAPTQLKLAVSHKSEMVYRTSIGFQMTERDAKGFNRRVNLFCSGKAGHSAYADSGVNALLKAIEFLQTTVSHGFDIQMTRIEGGETAHQVPDRARAEFYLTSHQFEDFKRFFKEMTQAEAPISAFRLELGGLGEAGISFFPTQILSCISDLVGFFKELLGELEKSWNEEFDPPTSTISLGKVTQGNRMVDLCFDIRLLPWISAEEVEKKIQLGIAKVGAKYPALNIKGFREQTNPGLEVPHDHEFVQLCQKAMEETGIRPELEKTSICTEAGLFSQRGFTALAFGPGQARGNIYGPDERNQMQQLQQAVSFYERMIEKVCL